LETQPTNSTIDEREISQRLTRDGIDISFDPRSLTQIYADLYEGTEKNDQAALDQHANKLQRSKVKAKSLGKMVLGKFKNSRPKAFDKL
jgi:hypothetical protein